MASQLQINHAALWFLLAFAVALWSWTASVLHKRRRCAGDQVEKDWQHFLHTSPRARMTYAPSDFLDYVVMLGVTHCLVCLTFGHRHMFSQLSAAGCTVLLIAFVFRHGTHIQTPAIVRDSFGLWRVASYKLRNVRPPLLVCLATLCLEQGFIVLTPNWRHHSETFVFWCSYVFYGSFWAITALRTIILALHICHRGHVFEFLDGSGWNKVLRGSSKPASESVPTSMQLLHLLHAFVTGLLCHILALGPLYVVLFSCQHSMLFVPLRLSVDGFALFWFWTFDFNDWLYRDHWVCHHDETAFLYLHGPHHDALPVSFMAAHDTGMLEGFLRFAVGLPDAYCSPLVACPLFAIQVLADMTFHQYVPGVFPFSGKVLQYGHHHAEHHFLRMHPLGTGFERPPDGSPFNTTAIDTRLARYDPNNKVWEWFSGEVRRIEQR